MRFNEVVCDSSMTPAHVGLRNNNPLQRSSSEIIINDKSDSLSKDWESREFRLGRETIAYSTLALNRSLNRNGKIQGHNRNNNLDNAYQSSSAESVADYEGYYEDPAEDLTSSDWSVYSEDANLPADCRGIVNPNYPGFQYLGPSLLSDTDDTDDEREIEDELIEEVGQEDAYNNNNNNNNNNNSDDVNNSNNNNNNNEVVDETVNRLDACRDEQKQLFYEKPKFDFQSVNSPTECMSYAKRAPVSPEPSEIFEAEVEVVQLTTSVKESLQFPEIEDIPPDPSKPEIEEHDESATLADPIDLIREANALNSAQRRASPSSPVTCISDEQKIKGIAMKKPPQHAEPPPPPPPRSAISGKLEEIDLLANIDLGPESGCRKHPVPDVVATEPAGLRGQEAQRRDPIEERTQAEPMASNAEAAPDPKKKEKMLRNQARRRQQQQQQQQQQKNAVAQRPGQEAKRRPETETGGFDVYNIETAMPKIDMDAIETHLKAAREEERRRRNDREEIRRRLAMGPDADDVRSERGRKPSLQSRLQSGMNLQICFMNETSSDSESGPGQEVDTDAGPPYASPPGSADSSKSTSSSSSMTGSPTKSQEALAGSRPQLLSLPSLRLDAGGFTGAPLDEADFFARQARLQTEARLALSQAKEMAHMQMEVERQKLKQNPITEMVRSSLQKIGVILTEDRRRLTRTLLTELNVAQLQVLANDLHARIAVLNDALVEGLLRRDDLHMEQDSMLVDVEDLTRYLGAKQESFEKRQHHQQQHYQQQQYQQRFLNRAPIRHSRLYMQQQQRQSPARSLTRLAAGRQLVVNLVRKQYEAALGVLAGTLRVGAGGALAPGPAC